MLKFSHGLILLSLVTVLLLGRRLPRTSLSRRTAAEFRKAWRIGCFSSCEALAALAELSFPKSRTSTAQEGPGLLLPQTPMAAQAETERQQLQQRIEVLEATCRPKREAGGGDPAGLFLKNLLYIYSLQYILFELQSFY